MAKSQEINIQVTENELKIIESTLDLLDQSTREKYMDINNRFLDDSTKAAFSNHRQRIANIWEKIEGLLEERQ